MAAFKSISKKKNSANECFSKKGPHTEIKEANKYGFTNVLGENIKLASPFPSEEIYVALLLKNYVDTR